MNCSPFYAIKTLNVVAIISELNNGVRNFLVNQFFRNILINLKSITPAQAGVQRIKVARDSFFYGGCLKKYFFQLLFLLFGFLASINFLHAENELLLIENTWIREAPPGVPTLAAYMEISNKTESSITITGVSSNASKKAEFHEVKMDNDVMQMRRLDEVIVQPGETVEFKSGGSHVMLMGVQESYEQGDEIEVVFELKDHSAVKVRIPVKKEL